MEKTNFTSAAFLRSHGKEPKGRGSWMFQQSMTWYAFDKDLTGSIVTAPVSTLSEAKRYMKAQHVGQAGLIWAVLP